MQEKVLAATGVGRPGNLATLVFLVAALTLIGLTSLVNYLLFHSLAEFYGVAIALTFFLIAWHTRSTIEHPSLAALGIFYLFISGLDMLHVLAYEGMGIFLGYDHPASQLWILTRFLQALSFLVFGFVDPRRPLVLGSLLAAYAAYCALGMASIFVFRVFPACFIGGTGQTPFKVWSELVIIAMFALSIPIVLRRGRDFPRPVLRGIVASIAIAILAEVLFALYRSTDDLVNLGGHLLKIVSYYLLYRAIVYTGLVHPVELLYARLRHREGELTKANEAQSTILSILAHDLRGLLGSISSASEILSTRPELFDETQRSTATSQIAEASGRSLALVERVLSWARASRGELAPRIEVIDLGELLHEQSALLAHAYGAKGVSLSTAIPGGAKAEADREMLATVLRNLLHNALKFSRPGEEVRVEAAASGERWRIAVRDSGVGMDSARLSSLFRPDLDNRSRGTGGERGTGLGLVLSRTLVERMGGRIDVESAVGKGSTFTVDLPLAAAAPGVPGVPANIS